MYVQFARRRGPTFRKNGLRLGRRRNDNRGGDKFRRN
jgi:hypothetical protein